MDTTILSLIVAGLAVFVGPIISWRIAKYQIRAASELANSQIAASLKSLNKQIIAPMRQAWINDLRDLLSELSSSALHYYVAGIEDRTDQEYQRLSLLQCKIQLMLNTREPDHERLENFMALLISSIHHQNGFIDEFPDMHNNFISLSRDVLKREWDRVKEPLSAAAELTST